MRLLVCSTEAPLPPLGGLRHPLRELLLRLREVCEVTLIAYAWPEQDPTPIDGINTTYLRVPADSVPRRGVSLARATIRGAPLRAVELEEPMRSTVAQTVATGRYDAVHLMGLPLASLFRTVRGLPTAMVVLDAWHVNAAAEVRNARPLVRPLKWLESSNTKRFEGSALRPFDRVVTVTESDADALNSLDSAITTSVIPNGVDTDFFSPDGEANGAGSKDIVFVGTMSWAPNIQAAEYAAREILPLVRASSPEVRLKVVGRGAAPSTVDRLEAYPGVTVVGEVPDVRPWLRQAAVAICPMVSGTGIKNKLLEALACEAPSVATTLACQGTALRDREHLLVADDPQALAIRVSEILGDDALAHRLGVAGRDYVRRVHSWDVVASTFRSLYGDILGERALVPG